jgi:hypothetical protein
LATAFELYAHFFLFRCVACDGYLAAVCASPQSNLEPADAHRFSLHCSCGWRGELLGCGAIRHWVDLGEYVDLTDVPRCSVTLSHAA